MQDKNIPLELLTLYVQIISNISPMFTKFYANTFIKSINQAVKEYIYNNTESNIR